MRGVGGGAGNVGGGSDVGVGCGEDVVCVCTLIELL